MTIINIFGMRESDRTQSNVYRVCLEFVLEDRRGSKAKR